MKTFFILPACLFLFQGLSAQIMTLPRQRPQPELFWDSNSLKIGIEHGTRLLVSKATGATEAIEPPQGCLGITAWKTRIIASRMNGGRFYCSERLASGKWFDYPIQFHQMESGFPEQLYESDYPGWFLGVNVDSGFVKEGQASCLAWYRQFDDGHLEMDQVVRLEWKNQPLFLASRQGETFSIASITPTLKGLVPFLDHPIRVPGAFILVSWQTGILWVLKDREESPSRTLDLVGIEPKLLSDSHPFPTAMLGIQPMKDGRVLMAYRDPRAIHRLEPAPPMDQVSQVGTEARPSGVPEYPAIIWRIWDPLEGTLWKADGAQMLDRAPATLPTSDAQWFFAFGFNLQGDFIFPWRSPSVSTPSDQPPKNDQHLNQSNGDRHPR